MKRAFDMTLILSPDLASLFFDKCYALGVSPERFFETIVEDMTCPEVNNQDQGLINAYLEGHTSFLEDDLSFSIWCLRNLYGEKILSCFDPDLNLLDQETLKDLYKKYSEAVPEVESLDYALEDAKNYVRHYNDFNINKNRS